MSGPGGRHDRAGATPGAHPGSTWAPGAEPTRRFSSRVADYARFRPAYPAALIPLLERACGLTRDTVVADIGSGTGILSRRFLDHGCRVIGVEPNREMREVAERLLAQAPRLESRDGAAEATGLEHASVDLVAAGQAFHWFEPEAARREFVRILRPGGWLVLAWNVRRNDADDFMRGYHALALEFGPEYEQLQRRRPAPDELRAMLRIEDFGQATLDNPQPVDLESLLGRARSTSYLPGRGDPRHVEFEARLTRLFREHARDGRVTLQHDCRVFYGRPG